MAEPLLAAEGLTKRFGGLAAVSDVSLAIGEDELVCVIGPNGAGKSTLLNMLCGAMRPTTGRIHFEGRDVVGLAPHAFARLGIARKFQVPSVFNSMTVRDNIEVAGLRPGIARAGAVSVDEVLALIDLEPRADAIATTLAHGQRQWLEIGMALMAGPKLLLVDEPTAGMTPAETENTAELLLGLLGRFAIIAIEHDMRFVRALRSRVVVMHQGRILRQGSFEQLERDEEIREVYLGRA